MNSKDQLEFSELLLISTVLLHAWRVGNDPSIQTAINQLSELLKRRDDRLRRETELKRVA